MENRIYPELSDIIIRVEEDGNIELFDHTDPNWRKWETEIKHIKSTIPICDFCNTVYDRILFFDNKYCCNSCLVEKFPIKASNLLDEFLFEE